MLGYLFKLANSISYNGKRQSRKRSGSGQFDLFEGILGIYTFNGSFTISIALTKALALGHTGLVSTESAGNHRETSARPSYRTFQSHAHTVSVDVIRSNGAWSSK